jgi:hypothetical protein
MPYETVATFTLCICAEDQCNEELSTCRPSAQRYFPPLLSTSAMPNLIQRIECATASSTAFVCEEHVSINATVCEEYVRSNSFLCSVVTNSTDTTQAALPENHYELFLDQTIHRLTRIRQTTNRNLLNESTDNFYAAYGFADGSMVQECVCTNPAGCNGNIRTCAPQIFQQTVTTTASPGPNRSVFLCQVVLFSLSISVECSRCSDRRTGSRRCRHCWDHLRYNSICPCNHC